MTVKPSQHEVLGMAVTTLQSSNLGPGIVWRVESLLSLVGCLIK